MFEVETDGEFYSEFLTIKAQLHRMMGGSYINELWNHPNERIHVTQLYTLFHVCEAQYPEDDSVGYLVPGLNMIYYNEPELPIITENPESIEHFKLWVSALYEQKEIAKVNRNLALQDELETKIEFVEEILQNHLSTKHRLVEEVSLSSRHRDIIRHYISRFLKSIAPDHPLLQAYIKTHIRIRKYSYWKS